MSKSKIYDLIGTVFGLGYLPLFPGTWGSFGGLAVCLLLHNNPKLYLAAFILFFIIGLIASANIEKRTGQKDPSYVVIDEFACIFLVYLAVPLSTAVIITGFILYRFMDIVKIPPIRALETLEGGWGIMLDDAMAAVYANLILQILIAINLF
ncbi:phosphatidylglycerophosphatase A [Candidatus Omnitrophota bacterium]